MTPSETDRPGASDGSTELDTALARVAVAERLLVASDFDGTLAPIADHPESVRPDPGACAALRALSRLRETHTAIVSGRERAVLHRLLGELGDGIRLIGSHGAETDASLVLSPAQRRLAEALVRDLEALAERHAGALVERKPSGVAFHYRRVAKEAQAASAREVLDGPGRRPGVRVLEGRKVVELSVIQADKGSAIEGLRDELDAGAVFFVGDDVTDEYVFARLGARDLGVKVGSGPTEATVRIEAQADVAPLLERLHALRSDATGRQ